MPISNSPYLIEGIYGEIDLDKCTIKPKIEKEYYKSIYKFIYTLILLYIYI